MKIVTYNIHYAIGKDNNYDLQRVIDAIRGADIIALQEVERNYGPPNQPSQPEDIAALLPNYYWVYDAAFDIDGSKLGDSGVVINQRKQHGQMLLSRWPILSKRYFLLPRLNVEHNFNMQMGMLEGIVVTPIGPLRIYVVHFGSESSEERQQQSRFVIDLVNNTPKRGGCWTGSAQDNAERDWSGGMSQPPMPAAALLLGDFNMTADSPEYKILNQATDEVGQKRFFDTWSETHPGEIIDTWHPNPGLEDGQASAMLDYQFISSELFPMTINSWIDTDTAGSDHQPVWLEISE